MRRLVVTPVLSALIGAAGATAPPGGRATLQQGMVNPGYQEKPDGFKQSFLAMLLAAGPGHADCMKDSSGEVFCSTVRQGAAQLDLYGAPRCEGRCEPASADYCEARAAGTP